VYTKGLRPVAANSVSIGWRSKGLALESSSGKDSLGLVIVTYDLNVILFSGCICFGGDGLSFVVRELITFEVKAFPNVKGTGLEADPKLIALKVVDNSARRAVGKGKLTLRGTPSDPLHTIPILSVGDFSYSTRTSSWSVLSERKLCAAENYLLFFVFRHYDEVQTLQVRSALESIQYTPQEDIQGSTAQTGIRRNKNL